MKFVLDINGEQTEVDVAPDTPLMWVLRDHLRLTGTKYGCGIAQCGACTVHVDGETRRSCVAPVSKMVGKRITTIEGVAGPEAAAVQKAWEKIDVPQCGYCQAGQIMSAVALLKKKKNPTEKDIDHGMAGNICRCATYMRIRRAIEEAAEELG